MDRWGIRGLETRVGRKCSSNRGGARLYSGGIHVGRVRGGCTALFIAHTNPREPCVSLSLKVGNTFLILSFSKAKGQTYLSCGVISHSDAVFL